MVVSYHGLDCMVLKGPPGCAGERHTSHSREDPLHAGLPLESRRTGTNGEAVQSCARSNPDAARPGNEQTERATLTISSRSRLLDLEASKQPSGGDGSIGEVSPGCASATMPAWSQPRRRIPAAVATEWYGDASEQIRQRRRYAISFAALLRNSLPLRRQQLLWRGTRARA
jgi:hypothetical protein